MSSVLIILAGLSHYSFAENLRLGGSFNYYAAADSIHKELYGNGGLMLGGFLSYELIKRLEIRGEAHYYQAKGNMSFTQEEITFTIIPIALGLRVWIVETQKLRPYLGTGFNFFSYKEELPDRFEDISESTTGIHFEAGTYLNLAKMFYLDFNVRYSFGTAESSYEDIKLGGLRAGIGIGIRF
jgi:outer membrane protein W